MVGHHGLSPRAKPGNVTTGLLGRVIIEVWRRGVRLQKLDVLVGHELLWEVHQRREESEVGHHLERGLVRPVNDLAILSVHPGHRLEGEPPEHDDAVEDPLDDIRGLLQRLEGSDVLGGDRVKRVERGVQRRLGGGEIPLRLCLHHVDLGGLLRHRVHDLLHLLLLLLGNRSGLGDLAQQPHRLLLRDLQLLVLHDNLVPHLGDVLLGLVQLLKPTVHLVGELHDLAVLAGVQLLVSGQKAEVRLWCHIAPLAELVVVGLARVADRGVDIAHQFDDLFLDLVRALDVEVLEELLGHCGQRLHGPRQEPVNGAAVDQPGELLRPLRELGPNGGEAQAGVQVGADPVEEELGKVLLGVHDAGGLLFHHGADVPENGINLVLGEEPRNLPCHQHLVDVLQKGLILDVCVSEDEAHLLALEPGNPVELLDVLQKVGQVVRFRQRHLEGVSAGGKGCEAGQGLLSGPSNADEEGAASIGGENSGHPHQVEQGVLEEHEVDLGSLGCIVLLGLECVAPLPHLLQPARDGLVVGGELVDHVPSLIVNDWLPEKVHEVQWLLKLWHRARKVVLEQRVDAVVHKVLL